MKNFTIKQMSAQVPVADLERSIAFYTQQLGFELAFRYGEFYAGIIKDGCSIHLKISEAPVLQNKPHDDDAPLQLLFSVDNIDSLYTELSA